MTQDEIDLDRDLWTLQPGLGATKIPPPGQPHMVPLPRAARTLLDDLPRAEGNPLVFWNVRGGLR